VDPIARLTAPGAIARIDPPTRRYGRSGPRAQAGGESLRAAQAWCARPLDSGRARPAFPREKISAPPHDGHRGVVRNEADSARTQTSREDHGVREQGSQASARLRGLGVRAGERGDDKGSGILNAPSRAEDARLVLVPLRSYIGVMRASGAAWVVASVLLSAGTAHAVTSTKVGSQRFRRERTQRVLDGGCTSSRLQWLARLGSCGPRRPASDPTGCPTRAARSGAHPRSSSRPAGIVENALAICEPDKTRASFACNEAGAPSVGGPFACYT